MMEGTLARIQDATPEALSTMLQLMSGHAIVQSVVVITELGIPDLPKITEHCFDKRDLHSATS